MSRSMTNETLDAGRPSAAAMRIGLYAIVVTAPLLVALVSKPTTDHPFVQELAKNLALIGYSVLAMQFVLAARFRWIERPFGLDIVFRFHRHMGILAAALLLAHPVLYASAGEWDLLFTLDHPWEISLGKVALLVVFVLVISVLFRKVLSLEFETWRGVHNGLALSALLLGFVHSMKAGGDFEAWPMPILWTLLLVVALSCYWHHKWRRPRRLVGRSYQVVRVEQETHDVTSLELAPSEDAVGIEHFPGQFGFLALHRRAGPIEEHPFTIASAPSSSGHVVTTIKASGDFTATINQTSVGDEAILDGPYGRFSYALHPEENDLVFVAAGVGITPMLSMLRHMRDENEGISVCLLYGNRQERDIIARAELEEIAENDAPSLTVVHVLSDPEEGWTGHRGRIDEALLRRESGALHGKAFYVCGPPAMTVSVTAALRHLGAPERRIHVEAFSL